jgi:hypothetical protein
VSKTKNRLEKKTFQKVMNSTIVCTRKNWVGMMKKIFFEKFNVKVDTFLGGSV